MPSPREKKMFKTGQKWATKKTIQNIDDMNIVEMYHNEILPVSNKQFGGGQFMTP